MKPRRLTTIKFYFLDDEDGEDRKLHTITTKSKNYISHNKKTVTVKVYLNDRFSGIYLGESKRTYPIKGYRKEYLDKIDTLRRKNGF